jgi:hypothetical protein
LKKPYSSETEEFVMKKLTCDVCHKDITLEVNGRGYSHVANIDICEDCRDKMNLELRPILRTKQPFNYEWYDRLVRDSLTKAISRGRW